MARIRSIKPEFFLDEELCILGLESQMLFIGLWVLADRRGRLEDRPLKIKAQIFPYREVPVDQRLSELHPKFITRYELESKKLIQINNFEKHQKPHPKEADSAFPAPSREKVVASREKDIASKPVSGKVVSVSGGFSGDIAPSKASEQPIMIFPVCGPGAREWGLTPEKVLEYREAFPGLDILGEFRKARQWLLDNPARKKTASGMSRFLGSWLSRAQNGGVGGKTGLQNRLGADPIPGKYDGIENRDDSNLG